MVELSIVPILFVSSDSNRYVYLEDDPDFVDPHEKVPSGSNLDMSNDDTDLKDLDLELKRWKKFKDSTRKGKFITKEQFAVDLLAGGEEGGCNGAEVGHHPQARIARLPQEEDIVVCRAMPYHCAWADLGL